MTTYGPAQPHEVVTGEAVALELRLAQLPSRALALMIDMVIQIVALIVVTIAVFLVGGSLDEAATAGLDLVLSLAVIVGYPLAFETLTRGKTAGKYALGLRAVRDDGGAIRFRHAFLRALIELVEIWMLIGIPALFCSLANSRGKRFGDLAAGTVVIRERVPAEAGHTALMPPELAGWAAVTDVGRVPDDLALAARQFLVRASELSGGARWSMGQRLAADVAPWLAPPPPPGVPAERLLAAVVAERRRRDEYRMASESAAARAWTTGPPTLATPQFPRQQPAPWTAGPNEAYGLRPAPATPPPTAAPAPDGDEGGFSAPS